ncbi:MAG: hypothetical protein WEB13_10550 [Dehalococcoidia bacterium]
MRDAIPLGATHSRPRLGGLARHAWRAAAHALARINGTKVAGSVHASDLAQLRRSMRD